MTRLVVIAGLTGAATYLALLGLRLHAYRLAAGCGALVAVLTVLTYRYAQEL